MSHSQVSGLQSLHWARCIRRPSHLHSPSSPIHPRSSLRCRSSQHFPPSTFPSRYSPEPSPSSRPTLFLSRSVGFSLPSSPSALSPPAPHLFPFPSWLRVLFILPLSPFRKFVPTLIRRSFRQGERRREEEREEEREGKGMRKGRKRRHSWKELKDSVVRAGLIDDRGVPKLHVYTVKLPCLKEATVADVDTTRFELR